MLFGNYNFHNNFVSRMSKSSIIRIVVYLEELLKDVSALPGNPLLDLTDFWSALRVLPAQFVATCHVELLSEMPGHDL